MLNVRNLTILSFIVMVFILIGSVSATDIDTNDTVTVSASDDEIIGVENDIDELGITTSTYSHLRDEIGSGKKSVNLSADYYSYDTGSSITIDTDNCVINGNGAVIDMAGSDIRAFSVSASGVTIKNLKIQNINFDSGSGGAIIFYNSGTVTDCTFQNDKATFSNGGALYFTDSGTVTNCNFVGNSANSYGGAVYFNNDGTVTNCNFNNNVANNGGAVYFKSLGTVTNCNFVSNTANENGGAVYFFDTGIVSNSNFTRNNANNGSAIYFYRSNSANTLTISNSIFLNNRANADALEVSKNDNNITITFTGGNNLLNAIYSREEAEISFTNVTYWGAEGKTNTGNSTVKPSRSNRAAGQNITVGISINDELVSDNVYVTDENGTIVLNSNTGEKYFIGVRHDADSYYTQAKEIISQNMTYYANVSSISTTNKTVNITAKSNIPNDFIQGKFIFIFPNSTEITANYAGGIWWAMYTFTDYGNYEVNASYSGLDNVTINNGTISITKPNSTVNISDIVMDYGESINITVLTEGAVGITAKIDGVDVDVVGNFTIMISDLNAGNHILTVNTIADANHNNITKNVTITVNKIKTQITASSITTVYNVNKNLVITLKDVDGNPLVGVKVTVNLNGAKTYTTDKKGQIKVSTKTLPAKTYTAKITFNGNTKYDESSKNVKVTVKKAKAKITANKKTFKNSIKVKKYSILLKDNTGKAIKKAKVTLKVNGKNYKATTNSKGKATFKITKLNKKGTFDGTITYKGNSNFDKVVKKVKLTVKSSSKSKFKTVSKGSKDSATVKKIQRALKNKGYYLTYDGHYLKIDGKYGDCTVRSVKEFQNDYGLKVTGKVDEKTARKLGII